MFYFYLFYCIKKFKEIFIFKYIYEVYTIIYTRYFDFLFIYFLYFNIYFIIWLIEFIRNLLRNKKQNVNVNICIEWWISTIQSWYFGISRQTFKPHQMKMKKKKKFLQLNSKLIIHFCANVVLLNKTLNKYFMHIIDSFM